MGVQVQDDTPDLGHEFQDLARLHVQLARSEVRDGTRRLRRGFLLLVWGVFAAGVGAIAAGIALFLLLQSFVPAWVAAAAVAIVFACGSAVVASLGRRQLSGTASLLLPRTRSMLRELFPWREKPTES